VVSGVQLVDRGEHRLRDLSGVEHLYQVCAEGLPTEFPPLRTLDAVPGNLPMVTTSFVGRDAEVKEVAELVRARRLLTLTGVGGVGKTRLALQVAVELVPDFGDGVWLVELAPVGDPAALPDAVATALGITRQAGLSVSDSIVQSLSGRRLLLVLDNCEHLLDAAALLVEKLMGRTTTVTVVATSREGLRVDAEQLWPVSPLDITQGADSAAVELFVARARAINPQFTLDDDVSVAVTEICRRLDGIALAIELAAARMVSMGPVEVLERLSDRFRLLSGSRRAVERHQTLDHAVGWSCDLLSDTERGVLQCCSVFAGGFDLAAATDVCGGVYEYGMVDALDALVRKSLVTTEWVAGRVRYGMLETIRQFAERQLSGTGVTDEVRDRHAAYFARQAAAHLDLWNGPSYQAVVEWADAEFDNLRTAFRWAADRGDLITATDIAAHTCVLTITLQRYEPVGWAEEVLTAATTADLARLPRLYTAAACCLYTGRADAGVAYAQAALALEAEPRYDPFTDHWAASLEVAAYLHAGRIDLVVDGCAVLAQRSGLAGIYGLSTLVFALPATGRAAEARTMADRAVAAARANGNQFWISWALLACGRAFADSDPTRALAALREGLDYARTHRVFFAEDLIARDAAPLEAVYGEPAQALGLFDSTVDSFHRSGNVADLAATLAYVAIFFDRVGKPDIAASIYGAVSRHGSVRLVPDLASVVAHICVDLGDTVVEECVAAGAAMEPADAVRYTRDQIGLARSALGASS
jgi:predicted ATPase